MLRIPGVQVRCIAPSDRRRLHKSDKLATLDPTPPCLTMSDAPPRSRTSGVATQTTRRPDQRGGRLLSRAHHTKDAPSQSPRHTRPRTWRCLPDQSAPKVSAVGVGLSRSKRRTTKLTDHHKPPRMDGAVVKPDDFGRVALWAFVGLFHEERAPAA